MEQLAHGSSAEEIYEQHRGYLSLAQIHAAPTYYYDNRAEDEGVGVRGGCEGGEAADDGGLAMDVGEPGGLVAGQQVAATKRGTGTNRPDSSQSPFRGLRCGVVCPVPANPEREADKPLLPLREKGTGTDRRD